MDHFLQLDWNTFFNTTPQNTEIHDTRTGEPRLLVQSPIPLQYIEHEHLFIEPTTQINDVASLPSPPLIEPDGYNREDENSNNEDSIVRIGVQDQGERATRRFFSTPCGQTYWVDPENRLYTNEYVDVPIGFWCHLDQCIYLNDGNDSDSETDDEYYEEPPTPPPIYEETDSSRGSTSPQSSCSHDEEIEGETILLGN